MSKEDNATKEPLVFGNREKLMTFLQNHPVGLTDGIGLKPFELEQAWATLERIRDRPGSVKFDSLSLLAAAHTTDARVASACRQNNIEVIFEKYDIERVVTTVAEVLKRLGTNINEKERMLLAQSILIVPYKAMERYDETLFGKVITEGLRHIKIIGIAISDRYPSEIISEESYTLREGKIICRPSDQDWERTVAHELVHALKIARAGNLEYDFVDEGLAALVEFLYTLDSEKQEAFFQQLANPQTLSEEELMTIRLNIIKVAGFSYANSAILILNKAKERKVGVGQILDEYLN